MEVVGFRGLRDGDAGLRPPCAPPSRKAHRVAASLSRRRAFRAARPSGSRQLSRSGPGQGEGWPGAEAVERSDRDQGCEARTLHRYDVWPRPAPEKLTELQHHYHAAVLSALHVHLDHDNCLEVVLVKGKAGLVQKLSNALIAIKGVKHGRFTPLI